MSNIETVSELLVSLSMDTKSFDTSLKNVNRSTKAMETAFNDAKKSLELSEKSIEDYSKAIKAGENAIKQYSNKLEVLEKAYKDQQETLKKHLKTQKELPQTIADAEKKLEELANTVGKGSKEYEKAEAKLKSYKNQFKNIDNTINASVNSLRSLESQIAKTNNKIKTTENSIADLNDEMNNMDSFSFGDYADLFDSLQGKIGGATSAISTVAKAFVNFGMDSVKWLGNVIKNVVILTSKIGLMVAGFSGISINLAGEFKAMNEMMEATFGKDLEKAEKRIESLAKNTGIAFGRLEQPFSQFYSQLKGSGIEAEEALKRTEQGLGLVADASAYYNMSMEEASELLRSFIRGNTEAGDRIGLFTSESQRNTKALEKYNKKWQDLTEAQKQMLMLDISEEIYKQSGALGQALRESEGLENVLGNLTYNMKEFIASIGSKMLDGAIKQIKDLGNVLGEASKIVQEQGLVKAFEYMVDEITKKLNSMADNIPDIMSNVIDAMSTFITNSLPSIMELGTKIITKISEGISTNREAISRGISNVISSISTFITTNMPTILEMGRTIISSLAEGIENNKESLGVAIESLVYTASSLFLEYKGLIVESALELGGSFVQGLWAGIWDAGQNYKPTNDNFYIPKEYFEEEGFNAGKDAGNKVGEGVKTGVEQSKENVKGASKQVATESSQALLDSLSNLSPETYQKMLDVAQKVRQSATDMYNGAKYSFSQLGKASKEAMTDMYKGVGTSMYMTSQKVRQEASNLYNGAKTSFVNLANVFRTQATNMRNIANNQFVSIKNIGLNQFKNLRDGVTSQMISMRNVVSTQWNNIRNTLSKSISGKVTVTRVTQNRTEKANEFGSNIPAFNPSVPSMTDAFRINTDNLNYRASSYQPTSITSKSIKATEKSNLETLSAIQQQNQLLTNMLEILMSERTTVVENNIQLDSRTIAKGTARFIEEEINSLTRRKNRLAGI